jgi:DNA-binding response OmpR family regulator
MFILVVEDGAELADFIARALAGERHRVRLAQMPAEAEAKLNEDGLHAIVLDLEWSNGNALEWCAALRGRGRDDPILLVVSRPNVHLRVAGLDAGADVVLERPFAISELRAWLRALNRRDTRGAQRAFVRGSVEIDFEARRAVVHGTLVPLTPREWSIVQFLQVHVGRVVPRDEILEAVGGAQNAAGEASLEILIGRIRKKLGATFIRTMRGRGYVID